MTTPFEIISRQSNEYYKTCIVKVQKTNLYKYVDNIPMYETSSINIPVSMPLDTTDEDGFITDFLTNTIKLQGF